MKSEAAVAILASEGLAHVAVSCQHARRSVVSLLHFLWFGLIAPIPTPFATLVLASMLAAL